MVSSVSARASNARVLADGATGLSIARLSQVRRALVTWGAVWRPRRKRSAESEPPVAVVDGPLADDRPIESLESLRERIERLRAANRSGREDVTERELLRALNDAGIRRVEAAPEDPEFIAPDEAGLPDAGDGLPEFAPQQLTAGLVRAAILRDGCALVRGLVPRECALRFAAEIDRAHEARVGCWMDFGAASAASEGGVGSNRLRLSRRDWTSGTRVVQRTQRQPAPCRCPWSRGLAARSLSIRSRRLRDNQAVLGEPTRNRDRGLDLCWLLRLVARMTTRYLREVFQGPCAIVLESSPRRQRGRRLRGGCASARIEQWPRTAAVVRRPDPGAACGAASSSRTSRCWR